MAKNNKNRRRDVSTIANPRLPPVNNRYVTRLPQSPLLKLRLFEDRRRWHPEGKYAPARSFSRSRHRLKVGEAPETVRRSGQTSRRDTRYAPKLRYPSATIGFTAPSSVLVCVRRNMRRQVLHALRKTGKVGQRRPRRSWYSSISCKRRRR